MDYLLDETLQVVKVTTDQATQTSQQTSQDQSIQTEGATEELDRPVLNADNIIAPEPSSQNNSGRARRQPRNWTEARLKHYVKSAHPDGSLVQGKDSSLSHRDAWFDSC